MENTGFFRRNEERGLKMLNTTLGYIEKDGCWLMMHRIRKKNDINQDKWIGIGGKFEPGETALECMKRECMEETGLYWKDPLLRGVVTFNFRKDEKSELFSEQMFLFSGSEFEGELKDCDEGELEWVPIEVVFSLPLWEGDFLFLRQIEKPCDFFFLKLEYLGDRLIYYDFSFQKPYS